jgi:iron complex outermembrane receptor protein
MNRPARPAALLALGLTGLCPPGARADGTDPLSTVVIAATRDAPLSTDLPVSASRLDARTLREGELEVNLSETLGEVPGVVAGNRQNYAQDLELSIRGFGARSSFGVRGVRLYSDGIPGTMPDGQGQFSQFDLGSAAAIEVLRGPFSALYGNSSGGVIAIVTEDGAPGAALDATAEGGSLGTRRYALKASGDTGAENYVADLSHFETQGYRNHSDAERNLFNGKLRLDPGDGSTLKLVVNAIETPFIQDPLGLTAAQWPTDPQAAGTGALAYDTRKSLTQVQSGLEYQRGLGADVDLAATVYAGHRHTVQFQAIPTTTEAIATSPGGVIDLSRDYYGGDARATARFTPAGGRLTLTAGVAYDRLDEGRLGFNNFIGSELGVEGALRAREANRVFDFDQYLEAEWAPLAPLLITLGVRNSTVDVSSTDLLAVTNPISAVHYGATNPVAGFSWKFTRLLEGYAAFGKGFETPTLNDLAYRSTDGSLPGLNLGLRPARSRDEELGLKLGKEELRGTLAAFAVRTHDELAVEANAGGRSVYENIGATERHGAEATLEAALPQGFSARLAETYLHAVTTEAYTTCVGLPCRKAQVPAGVHLPAVPENDLYAALGWRSAPQRFAAALEIVNHTALYADDRNTTWAPGYWVENLHATWFQAVGAWQLDESLRLDNLGDRRYVGTVIVNESNGRYFEPAPGRTLYVLFHAKYR